MNKGNQIIIVLRYREMDGRLQIMNSECDDWKSKHIN
jgi:hypothetical protein